MIYFSAGGFGFAASSRSCSDFGSSRNLSRNSAKVTRRSLRSWSSVSPSMCLSTAVKI